MAAVEGSNERGLLSGRLAVPTRLQRPGKLRSEAVVAHGLEMYAAFSS